MTEYSPEQMIFDCIVKYIKEHGYSPSVRDLCEMSGYKSTSSVHKLVRGLIEKGKIETDHEFGTPRALRVVGYEFRKL